MTWRGLSKDFFVCTASGLFIGAVVFDIFPEVSDELGQTKAFVFILIGLLIWHLLKLFTDYLSKNSLAIVSVLAFWFHSFLEGAVTALSFSFSIGTGLAVATGMILHLVPEFFAIVALMQGEGVSLKKSVLVDFGGIITLLISFTIVYFLLKEINESVLGILIAVSGGAFLYIGVVSFLKRAKNSWNIWGLLTGLLIIGIWNIFFRGV